MAILVLYVYLTVILDHKIFWGAKWVNLVCYFERMIILCSQVLQMFATNEGDSVDISSFVVTQFMAFSKRTRLFPMMAELLWIELSSWWC